MTEPMRPSGADDERSWRLRLEATHVGCRRAFEELLRAGCEERLQVTSLWTLNASRGLTKRSPRNLTVLATKLEKCATDLDRLGGTEVGGIVGGYGERQALSKSLCSFASTLKKTASGLPRSRNQWESNALMRLEDYVRKATGKPHFTALDTLASAILGRDISVREPVARYRKQFGRSPSSRARRGGDGPGVAVAATPVSRRRQQPRP